jgi:hypothetical protein
MTKVCGDYIWLMHSIMREAVQVPLLQADLLPAGPPQAEPQLLAQPLEQGQKLQLGLELVVPQQQQVAARQRVLVGVQPST